MGQCRQALSISSTSTRGDYGYYRSKKSEVSSSHLFAFFPKVSCRKVHYIQITHSEKSTNMPCGKKRKRNKIATHKRKKRLRMNRHKKK